MEYLIGFTSEQSVKDFSESLYVRPKGAFTKYRFAWAKHPSKSEWALRVPIIDKSELSQEKQALLQDFSTLESGNWFANEEKL